MDKNIAARKNYKPNTGYMALNTGHAAIKKKLRHISANLKKYVWAFIRMVLVFGICYIILYPIFTKICVSIMATEDLYDMTVKYVPKHFTLWNFKFVLEKMEYFEALKNSMGLSFAVTILQVISCTIVGYGFARFKFKGRNLLFGVVVLTLLVPPQTFMVSSYLQFRYFDLFGILKPFTNGAGINFIGSVVPMGLLAATCMGIKNGLYIYIMRQFFRNMPKETEESALVDGAGMFRIFHTIMLPNAIPAIITIFLFSFVWQWNDTYYSALFVPALNTLTNAIISLPYEAAGNWGLPLLGYYDDVFSSMLMDTALLLIIAPLILIYVFTQKYMVTSIERTGIVG